MSEEPAKPAAPSAGDAAPSSHLPATVAPPPQPAGPVFAALAQLLAALRFYSRLPIPPLRFETAPHAALDFTKAPPAVAAAGAILGALAGLVLIAAATAGLPPLLGALLALATLIVITGVFHEDGLADTADGLWGGLTPDRRLEIMRDSRIGSYGTAAMILSIAIRATALATIAERLGVPVAALALIGVSATSRVAGLLPLWLLPPARADGAAASVQGPTTASLALGAVCASAIALIAMAGTSIGALAMLCGVAVAFAAAFVISRVAAVKIGGHTGDIAGAAQQLGEIAMLIALVAVTAPA